MKTIVSTNPNHSHHWIIETANGPNSEGVCKFCHAHRDFPNWLPGLDFRGSDERGADRQPASRTW